MKSKASKLRISWMLIKNLGWKPEKEGR